MVIAVLLTALLLILSVTLADNEVLQTVDAWGDQWTNMIQPLFAIPALAIAGLHIPDIIGYFVIALLFTGMVFVGALALL